MQTGDQQAELFVQSSVLPIGLVYAPDFISADEEAALIAAIQILPLQSARYREFTAKRRTVSFDSQYDLTTNKVDSAPPLPQFLSPLRDRTAAAFDIPIAQFAHALVTEYETGAALGWHRDAMQFGIVVGISLASAARMRLRPYPPRDNKREGVITLELAPRSAYVISGDARWRWQHSIPPTKALRYSITFRTLSRSKRSDADG